MQISPHAFVTTGTAPGTVDAAPSFWSKLFGDDGLSFRDVLDLVNPLQHIPVVGYLYRKLTGDTIDPAIRIAGGALFGGPIGAVLSVGSMLMERGRDADVSPVTEVASSALAESPSSPPYRGGWLVNAALTGQLPPFAPSPMPATEAPVKSPAKIAETNRPEVRRGGWMVAQAYALSDSQQAASSAAAGRFDDVV